MPLNTDKTDNIALGIGGVVIIGGIVAEFGGGGILGLLCFFSFIILSYFYINLVVFRQKFVFFA